MVLFVNNKKINMKNMENTATDHWSLGKLIWENCKPMKPVSNNLLTIDFKIFKIQETDFFFFLNRDLSMTYL